MWKPGTVPLFLSGYNRRQRVFVKHAVVLVLYNIHFFLKPAQENPGRFGKYLVFFPHNIQACFQGRLQRTEYQIAVSTGVNQLIQS